MTESITHPENLIRGRRYGVHAKVRTKSDQQGYQQTAIFTAKFIGLESHIGKLWVKWRAGTDEEWLQWRDVITIKEIGRDRS